MPRILPRIALAALAAVAVMLLTVTLWPGARLPEAQVAQCRRDTSAACLTDLGIALAQQQDEVPGYLHEVAWLARMGRFEAAHRLETQVELNKGSTPEEAKAAADSTLASHKLAAALRQGIPLGQAVQETPGVGPGALWIAALDLLGRSPYGDPPDVPRKPDADLAALLGEIALKIEELTRAEVGGPRPYQLVYAAKIHAIAGDREAALAALAQFPQNKGARPPHINYSIELMRTVGTGPALAAYVEAGATSPFVLLAAAKAEDDADRAAAFLRRAFEAYMSEKPWPDFDYLVRTVESAVDAGQSDLALEFARRLAEVARSLRYPFQVFANIDAAEALLAAGAPSEEVRASVDFAIGLFPEDENQYLATGVHMGPILWKPSGLASQARRNIAALAVRLGDLELARRVIEGVEKEKLFVWFGVLRSDITAGHYLQILGWAGEALSPGDFAYLRASLAASLMDAPTSEAHRRWAVETARELVKDDLPEGRLGIKACSEILRVAEVAEDRNLQQAALTALSEAALDDPSFFALIRAGVEWHLARELAEP